MAQETSPETQQDLLDAEKASQSVVPPDRTGVEQDKRYEDTSLSSMLGISLLVQAFKVCP